ncbi:hypothetical protein [Treponema zioleckii]|uniref:hypothetical protein n=1 Tax=Treponema zioleckii TaxID=331680 RepID=UPI00168A8782|nr:hypothetical protein [Treponema zioleckii]
MIQKYSSFTYKAGNSFVHKMPAWIKILIIPILSVFFFNAPYYISLTLFFAQMILSFSIKFTLREQISDLKLVLYFGLLLYSVNFFATAASEFFDENNAQNLIQVLHTSFQTCLKNTATALMLLKLLCVLQTSSIIFKTSTSLELREGIGKIESAIRRIFHLKDKNTISHIFALILCFIPMIFHVWNQAVYAWKGRHGKTSLRMYLTLFPVLFSVSMKNAFDTAKAVAIRS